MKKFDWRSLLRLQGGSVLMIVCGAILTVSPDSASVLICAVLGWLLIAAGAGLLVVGFVGGMELVTIIQGAFLLVAGAWLHRNPLMIVSVLGRLLGIVALSQGWRKGMLAWQTKQYGGIWIWDAGLAALELLAGLMLIVTPLRLSRLVTTLAGLFMVICGAADLVASWKGRRYLEGSGNIIDAD